MNKKYIIPIILIIILVVFCISLVLLKTFSEKENETMAITGTITDINQAYLLIYDNATNMEYIIYADIDSYRIGDEIKVYTDKPILESYPAQISASKIEVLKESTVLEDNINNSDIPENKEINVESENIVDKGNDIDSNGSVKTDEPPEVKNESVVISYFQKTESNIDSPSAAESVKNSFIKIVDFLFYDGEINGYKFQDLTDSAKLQVLKIALKIDKKMDTVFPGYKQSIGSASGKLYNDVKNKIVIEYLDLSVKVCSEKKDICEVAKKDFQDMKQAFNLTWDFIVTLTKSGISKLSEWYIIWSGK